VSRVEERIARATAAIDSVQADRDAVASDIDTTTVDELLDRAITLRDDALGSGDDDDALRLAFGAVATARVARRVIIADLSYPGLPSQADVAQEILSRADDAISTLTETSIDSALIDVGFYVTAGQAMYQAAEVDFSGEAYAKAALRARAAGELVAIPYKVLGFLGIGRRRSRRDGATLPFGHDDHTDLGEIPAENSSPDDEGSEATPGARI
jgi:hypothetical protein